MERVEQVKQSFVDFMEQKQQQNSSPTAWNSSGETSSALSKSSSSVVMSNDGSFPYGTHCHAGHAHHSSIPCESSTQSGPMLKEHDYIGLGEVSSASSSVNEDDGSRGVEDTDLRLGLGPLREDLCAVQHASQQKAQPLFEFELLEPKDKPQGSHLAFTNGFTSATAVPPSKNGFKRAYEEALGEAIPGTNMASAAAIAAFKQSQGVVEHQQNVFLSNWPASKTNGLGSNTNANVRPNELRDYESARAEPPPAKGQVVGWPPIRSYRKNTLVVPRTPSVLDGEGQSAVYVKVNMDGIPIGRKVDLNVYRSYESLLAALEEMFYSPSSGNGSHFLSNAEFVLTYEDKEGDWMLVGDVPWGMFVNTVRRLRIVRGSEATGLAPRR
eukprot:c20326_g1_i1 orf=674-1822(-)